MRVHQHTGYVNAVRSFTEDPFYFAVCHHCGCDPFPYDRATWDQAHADLEAHVATTGVEVRLAQQTDEGGAL